MSGRSSVYDRALVSKWYRSLPAAAKAIAQNASNQTFERELDASELVSGYLRKPELVEAFGGPAKGLEIVSAPDDFPELYTTAWWGRRCSHYLEAISKGILKQVEVEYDEDLHALAEQISNDVTTIRTKYRRRRRKGDTLLNSLKIGHGVANFVNTYLDPVLFSSLGAFASLGDEFHSEDVNSEKYNQLGIDSTTTFNKLKTLLMDLIRRDVLLYATNGNARSAILVDEATLWWGVYELIRYKCGREFYIDDQKKRGMFVATQFLKQLLTWTKVSTAYPDFGIAQSEITCEIHCPLRTQLFIAKNAIQLHELQWPEDVEHDVSASLKDLIEWALAEAQASWRDSLHLQKHAYFIGLALEVLTMYQEVHGGLDFVSPSTKSEAPIQTDYARVWTNVPDAGSAALDDGAPLNEVEYHRWVARMDEFKIFVVDDDGQFRAEEHVGIVYLNKMRISRQPIEGDSDKSVYDDTREYLSRSGAYRILVRLLKNNGNAGTSYHIIKDCWRSDEIIVDFFNRCWNFKKMRLDLGRKKPNENDRSESLINTPKNSLNNFLKRHLGCEVVKVQGNHKIKDMPSFCFIEIIKHEI